MVADSPEKEPPGEAGPSVREDSEEADLLEKERLVKGAGWGMVK